MYAFLIPPTRNNYTPTTAILSKAKNTKRNITYVRITSSYTVFSKTFTSFDLELFYFSYLY
jgi:hypothetical protein